MSILRALPRLGLTRTSGSTAAARSSLHYTQAREDLSSTLGYVYKELGFFIDSSTYDKAGAKGAAALEFVQAHLAGQRVFLSSSPSDIARGPAGPLFVDAGRVFADLEMGEGGDGGGGSFGRGDKDIAPFAYQLDFSQHPQAGR